MSHVANGDMVTLALIQGVVNTFVVFFAKIIGILVDRVLLKNDERNGPGIGAFVAEIVAQIVLGILASMIVMWFSRQREFRADAGGANLAGRQKMISALERLKANHEQAAAMPQNMSAMAISSGRWFLTFVYDAPAAGRAYRSVARRSVNGVVKQKRRVIPAVFYSSSSYFWRGGLPS